MINGRIETIYKDNDNITAIFPTTIVDAVYNSEGVLIDNIYQKKLVAGTNIVTINGNSILTTGNLDIMVTTSEGVLTPLDVIDDLSSSLANKPLSANQGRILNEAVNNLPSAMIFKGSLGTGGTKTDLDTPTGTMIGYTYQVITAGTYASKSAKVGDLFVCNDTPEWILLPTTSASGTLINVATGTGLTGGPITTTGTISLANCGTAGTYTKVTTDAYGRVSSGTTLSATDIPNLDASKITSGTLADARIPNLDASKITSGTFADERIASADAWNNKYDMPKDGIPKSDLTTEVQTSLGKADTAIQNLSGLGITASATELNKLAGLSVTKTELEYLSGISSNVQSQLNSKPDSLTDLGVTATSTELNILDGATLTTTELNYVDGVTSSIQTQLDSKQATLTQGDGITISSNTVSNAGVRSIAQNSSDGHKLTINTGGTSATITIPDNNTTYTAGTGLSLSGTTFNHSNSVTADSTLCLKFFTYDAQGHVVSSTNKTLGRGLSDSSNVIGHSNSITAMTAIDTANKHISNLTIDAQGHISASPTTRVAYGTITLPIQSAAGTVSISTPTDMAITANDNPTLDVLITSTSTEAAELLSWAKVYKAETAANSIKFYLSDATTAALTIQIKN